MSLSSYLDQTVEIGEIPVEIKYVYCCGQVEYFGKFPDGTFCCKYPEHSDADEAIECSKERVAEGFVVREVKEEAV